MGSGLFLLDEPDVLKKEGENGDGNPTGADGSGSGGVESTQVRRIVRDTALFPPDITPRFDIVPGPFKGAMAKVVKRGGYEGVVGREGKVVRFAFQGCWRKGLVRGIVREDGEERGLQWECGVERWVDDLGEKEGRIGVWENGEQDLGDENEVNVLSQWEQEGEGEEGLMTGEDDEEGEEKPKGRVYYLLVFEDNAEAARFARRWHKRIVPLPDFVDETKATAEVLW